MIFHCLEQRRILSALCCQGKLRKDALSARCLKAVLNILQKMLFINRKRTGNMGFRVLFSFVNDLLIDFDIVFRKTKQKIITFIATALISLLSVAKTNCGLSRSKLHTRDVNYLFSIIFFHTSSYKNKKCANLG